MPSEKLRLLLKIYRDQSYNTSLDPEIKRELYLEIDKLEAERDDYRRALKVSCRAMSEYLDEKDIENFGGEVHESCAIEEAKDRWKELKQEEQDAELGRKIRFYRKTSKDYQARLANYIGRLVVTKNQEMRASIAKDVHVCIDQLEANAVSDWELGRLVKKLPETVKGSIWYLAFDGAAKMWSVVYMGNTGHFSITPEGAINDFLKEFDNATGGR